MITTTPPAGTIADLWTLDPRSDAARDRYQEYLSLLSSTELQRMHRFVAPQRRRVYVLGHGMARTALSARRQDVAPSDWQLGTAPGGRPTVHGPLAGGRARAEELRLSLSHTDTLVACLVTNAGAGGVDVETVDPGADVPALAGMILTDLERDRLNALPLRAQRVELFRYWTLKEAYGKACGVGLSMPVRRHTFHLGGPAVVVQPPDRDTVARGWSFSQWQPADNQIIAVALRAGSGPIQLSLRQPDRPTNSKPCSQNSAAEQVSATAVRPPIRYRAEQHAA
ncbi:MAG TPA: 4'-phosphopantetheinyl transferase superfamily protein [Propionibacteriaceae bacterium]|nr:4'-phosphopantetheinyl transferase superfamily protein [Propionibacteriaceae bacterium]